MTVLVLNHRPLGMRPIGRWIEEAGPLVMVTSRAARAESPPEEQARFAQIVAVDGYKSWEIEVAARALARRWRPDRIASSNEFDLIRGAVLREELGLPGQDVSGALAYRDKLSMRQAAAGGGVRIPRFAPVVSAADAAAFTEGAGFPVVIKPRRGFGSTGITVVHRREDLVRAVAVGSAAVPGGLLVEEYVDAPLFHVDGIAVDGKVIHCWPSRYSAAGVPTVQAALPRVSTMLDAGDPLREGLQDFAVRVVAAFPNSGSFAFHLEAWVDETGLPILCEITSRTGGGPIGAAYEHAFGVNLYAESFRGQSGLPLNLLEQPEAPARYSGWAGFLERPGLFVPPVQGPPPVVWLRVDYPAGRTCTGARLVSDAAAWALLDGGSAQEVRQRVQDVVGWWEASRPWR